MSARTFAVQLADKTAGQYKCKAYTLHRTHITLARTRPPVQLRKCARIMVRQLKLYAKHGTVQKRPVW